MWECVGEENQERATAGILVANQPGRLEGGDEAMDGRGVRASTERGNQTLSFGGNPATWPAGETILPDMAGTRTVPRMAREMTRVCIIDASSLLPPLSRLPSPQLPALRPPPSSTSDGIAGLCSDAARWRTEARTCPERRTRRRDGVNMNMERADGRAEAVRRIGGPIEDRTSHDAPAFGFQTLDR